MFARFISRPVVSVFSLIAAFSFSVPSVANIPTRDAERVILDLANSGNRQVSVALCETEESSRQCKSGSKGIRGVGLGGIFLPLGLNIERIVSQNGEFSFVSKINGVETRCAPTKIKKRRKQGDLQFDPFYCNWLIIGNVVANFRFDVDWVSDNNRSFGGEYRVSFIGTGNGGGKGYYRANR